MSSIIIVGAGACGLMAGQLLSREGHAVQVFEARPRIGGRIHTDVDSFSRWTELGAEFIHGDQPFTLSLLKDGQIKTSRLDGCWYQFRNGQIHKAELFNQQWEEMMAKLNELQEDTDIASFLKTNFAGEKYRGMRERVTQFVEGYDAADTGKVSAFALREEWSATDEEEQWRIENGYGEMLRQIYQGLINSGGSVALSCIVKRIEWGAQWVKVHLDNGEVHCAELIIITVPIGTLQRKSIDFSPQLPFPERLFQHIGFGGVIKFLFEFREPFWNDYVLARYKSLAFVLSDAEIPTWWTQTPRDVPILTGWWGGPSTYERAHSEEELFDKAVRSLSYIFNAKAEAIKNEINTYKIIDWVADPFSFGAYAYATTKTEHARTVISTPIDSTMYFAGEALYSGPAMGTVEAALISGREVARRIIRLQSMGAVDIS